MSKQEIILGDCLEVMRTFKDKEFDLVLTDPPYGINYSPNYKRFNGDKNEWSKISNDNGELDYSALLRELERIATTIIVFGAENFFQSLPHAGRWICWDKRAEGITNEMPASPFELAWVNKTSGFYKLYRVLSGGVVNPDSIIGNNQKRFHPTQKPVSLFEQILNDYSEPTDKILDPFLGSGTTALAAQSLQREMVGIEISPEYCKIAQDRLDAQPNSLFAPIVI